MNKRTNKHKKSLRREKNTQDSSQEILKSDILAGFSGKKKNLCDFDEMPNNPPPTPPLPIPLPVPLSFLKGGVHAMIYWWHQYVKHSEEGGREKEEKEVKRRKNRKEKESKQK